MLIPDYWAEHIIKITHQRKRITLKRFGWSDISQEEATIHAIERAEAAFASLQQGKLIEKNEPRTAYGEPGLPIREEKLQVIGKNVITRNTYGARCLNTPNVLFADIDTYFEPKFLLIFSIIISSFVAASCKIFFKLNNQLTIALIAILAFFIAFKLINKLLRKQFDKNKTMHAHQSIVNFLKTHPEWHIRLYQTPLGFRALVMHKTFEPSDPKVKDFFTVLNVDPVYQYMCQIQQCFRARISAKPWRIGIRKNIKPRYHAYPFKPSYLPERNAWIEAYEKSNQNFAACRFIQAFGSNTTTLETLEIQKIHDQESKAMTTLPLA